MTETPADAIGNAVRVMQIATGDVKEAIVDDGKDLMQGSWREGWQGAGRYPIVRTPERDCSNCRKKEVGKQITPCHVDFYHLQVGRIYQHGDSL